MSRPLVVDLFAEDRAHEEFLIPLIRRVAGQEGFVAEVRVRSARGGHGHALQELDLYQRGMAKGVLGLSQPDVSIARAAARGASSTSWTIW